MNYKKKEITRYKYRGQPHLGDFREAPGDVSCIAKFEPKGHYTNSYRKEEITRYKYRGRTHLGNSQKAPSSGASREPSAGPIKAQSLRSHRVPLPSLFGVDFGTFWGGFGCDFGWIWELFLDPITSIIVREKGRGPDPEGGKLGRGRSSLA